VADESPLVDVGVAAAAAVFGVEGVLQLRQRLGGVLDAEVEDALAAPSALVSAGISSTMAKAAVPPGRRCPRTAPTQATRYCGPSRLCSTS
jgi:hypothetical protein